MTGFQSKRTAIQRLWGLDKGFEATSHELHQLELKLDKLTAGTDPADPNEIDQLKIET
jgi:hypothetical protein